MSLLIPGPAVNPIILPMGRAVAPAPYTGTWYPYLFLTCQPDGELYLGLGSYPYLKGGIYRTINYGDTWEQVLNHDDFGGEDYIPVHLMPATDSFLVARYQEVDPPWGFNIYRAAAIEGPYSLVLGGDGYDTIWRGWPNFWRLDGGDTIWVTGQRFEGGVRPQAHKSSDAGQTWLSIFNRNYHHIYSQIRVNAAVTKGLIGGAGPGVSDQDRRSNNPGATPGTWSTLGIAARGHRFGVSWPYCVIPYNTYYWYSSDNGESGVQKDIPLGMQTGGDLFYNAGIDMSPHDRNLILSAPPYEDAGVWLSKDFGDSWTKVLDNLGPPPGGDIHYQNGVMFDLYDPLKAYAWGIVGFFRSEDAGETWQARSGGLEEGQG